MKTLPAAALVAGALSLFAFAGAALAQAAPAATPTLTVTGEGHVDAAPDMATVSLGVTTEGATAADALAANNAAQTEILAALTAAGVVARDVQTSGLNLNPVWDNRPVENGIPKISGYMASNVVTIRARDLDRLGALLDAVVTTGANQLNSLTFGLSDPQPAMDEARKRAVADARARAALYAEAAGVALGPILSITEGGGYQPPQPMYRRELAMDAGVPVAGGEVSVSASVTITYAIGE
jgi:uncharacterized protein YggE